MCVPCWDVPQIKVRGQNHSAIIKSRVGEAAKTNLHKKPVQTRGWTIFKSQLLCGETWIEDDY